MSTRTTCHARGRSVFACMVVLALVGPATAIAGAVGALPPTHVLLDQIEAQYPGGLVQDAPGGPRFGFSVAMYGDTLAVGAPNAHVNSVFEQAGAAFIFRRQDNEWFLQQAYPFDFIGLAGSHMECGHAVALDAYNLLIGCPGNSGQAGTVKRLTRPTPDSPYALDSVSFNEGTAAGDRCGHSLALLGTSNSGTYPLAAIGCPGRNVGQGAVDIQFYCLPFAPCSIVIGAGWHPLNSLDGNGPERFGHSLSLAWYFGANVLLAVGAPEHGAGNDGRAYVYRTNADLDPWISDAVIPGTNGGRFGYSVEVAAAGTSLAYLAVGAPTRNVLVLSRGGPDPVPVGSVSVATRTAFGWGAPDEKIGAWLGGTIAQNRLGHAVDIPSADTPVRILAGEPDFPMVAARGRVRHYYWDSNPLDWYLAQDEPFFTPPELVGSGLGTALDSDDGWLALGAPGYPDVSGEPEGRVFLYAYGDILFQDHFE